MPDISEPKSRGPSSAGAGSVSGEPRAAKVAVAALVLGMIAFVPVIGPPFGLIAMLCGAIALIKETVHKKLAMLGLALGFVGNLVSVGTLLLLSMWFSSYVEEAMVKEARAEIARLEGVVDTYRALSDSQELPESLDDLTRPPDGSAAEAATTASSYRTPSKAPTQPCSAPVPAASRPCGSSTRPSSSGSRSSRSSATGAS